MVRVLSPKASFVSPVHHNGGGRSSLQVVYTSMKHWSLLLASMTPVQVSFDLYINAVILFTKIMSPHCYFNNLTRTIWPLDSGNGCDYTNYISGCRILQNSMEKSGNYCVSRSIVPLGPARHFSFNHLSSPGSRYRISSPFLKLRIFPSLFLKS